MKQNKSWYIKIYLYWNENAIKQCRIRNDYDDEIDRMIKFYFSKIYLLK